MLMSSVYIKTIHTYREMHWLHFGINCILFTSFTCASGRCSMNSSTIFRVIFLASHVSAGYVMIVYICEIIAQFLFKLPGKSQHICTETLRKLHDNREITMQSRYGFYMYEEHVRSRWGLRTARAITQKGSSDAHIASARCPCGHCAMQKRYVDGLRTYTFFKNDNKYFRAREPKRPISYGLCMETICTEDTSKTRRRGELKV